MEFELRLFGDNKKLSPSCVRTSGSLTVSKRVGICAHYNICMKRVRDIATAYMNSEVVLLLHVPQHALQHEIFDH